MLKILSLVFGLFVFCGCQCPDGALDLNERGCFLPIANIISWWYIAENLCSPYNGHLAIINDCALLGDVAKYLSENLTSQPTNGFWIDATDAVNEGVWLSSDGSSVPMGVPFWGVTNTPDESRMPEPNGGTDENCAMLSSSDQYYFHDENCTKLANALCRINTTTSLPTLDQLHYEKFIKPKDDITCPDGFVEISNSNSCFHFHYDPNSDVDLRTTWTDGYHMCPDMYEGSTLAILSNCDEFKAVVDFINSTVEYQLQPGNSYWIGGTDTNDEGNFSWIDSANTPIAFRPPFWGSYNGVTEPSGGTSQNCVVLYRDDLYYFHDTICDKKAYPLCQTDPILK